MARGVHQGYARPIELVAVVHHDVGGAGLKGWVEAVGRAHEPPPQLAGSHERGRLPPRQHLGLGAVDYHLCPIGSADVGGVARVVEVGVGEYQVIDAHHPVAAQPLVELGPTLR